MPDKQEKEQMYVCLVVADMIRHHEVVFGGVRYNNTGEIKLHRYVNYPTLNPKKKMKPPPPPVSKSPAKITRNILF